MMTSAGKINIAFMILVLPSLLVKNVQPFRGMSGASRRTSTYWKTSQRRGSLCEIQLRSKHRQEQVLTRMLSSSLSSSSSSSVLTESDEEYLRQAVQYAKLGLGYTYPNPIVGCVLVRQDTNEVIGCGFHPISGSPHAEVFALLEAKGHVPSGVEAAKSVLNGDRGVSKNRDMADIVHALAKTYASTGGPEELFEQSASTDTSDSFPVTAYVTLEPCCHFGRTPPCANSLIISKNVKRVVVGFRDPNPRVDGGGVKLLQDAGIQVDMAEIGSEIHTQCADMTKNFVKRITAPSPHNYDELINGAMRSALRSLAGRKKSEDTLVHHIWNGREIEVSGENDTNDSSSDDGGSQGADDSSSKDVSNQIDTLPLDPTWMEELDAKLWDNEIVNLKLNKAIKKKKWVKQLGNRIGQELDAHVAQTVGHSVLLYRPGMPPVLDLKQLVEERTKKD